MNMKIKTKNLLNNYEENNKKQISKQSIENIERRLGVIDTILKRIKDLDEHKTFNILLVKINYLLQLNYIEILKELKNIGIK